MVGEHFKRAEAGLARAGVVFGRENVGMSNHNPNENLGLRKSKGSSVTEIDGGLGDPKAMAKAAADGKLVNIPAPLYSSMG